MPSSGSRQPVNLAVICLSTMAPRRPSTAASGVGICEGWHWIRDTQPHEDAHHYRRLDSKCVTSCLAGPASIERGRWACLLSVLQSVSAATDLDLISYLKAIPDARMRRGVRIPAWYLLLVAVLGILSKCESLRDLERFARRHHAELTEALGLELKRPPSDSAFRYFFLQVDFAAVCAAINDWTIAQIPGGAANLD